MALKFRKLATLLISLFVVGTVFAGSVSSPNNSSNTAPVVRIEDVIVNGNSEFVEKNIIMTGSEDWGELGWFVSEAGDVNGDGFDDFIVGVPGVPTLGGGAGKAFIYFGGYLVDNIADVVLTGEVDGDMFGSSVSAAGDVNGDGYDDVIVGAPANDAGAPDAGRAYVYFGGNPMDNAADVIISGDEQTEFLGHFVSTAGDVNGDGFDDAIVDSVLGNSAAGDYGRGEAYIFFGSNLMDNIPDITITHVPQGYTVGDTQLSPVSTAGDVNADGYSDVIVGRPYEEGFGKGGRAYLYLGGDSMDNTSDLVFAGEGLSDQFGACVANAGDVNADGYDDIIIGARGYDPQGSPYIGAGRAYIFYGGVIMDDLPDLIMDSEGINDIFGYFVSTAGDINNDGFSDVIIGAPGNSSIGPASGKAYLFYGGSEMDNSTDIILSGEASKDFFGVSVSTAGDVNNDGYDDSIVGAYTNDAGGLQAGRAYLRISPYVMANEGDEFQFTGNFTDPDVGDTHTIEWDFGDGNTASGNLTPLHAYGDDGVYNPSLTVFDSQGGVGRQSVQVIVNNVAPKAEAGGPYYGYIGIPVNITGSCYDPGYLDTHTYTWDMDRNGYVGDKVGAATSWTWNAEGRYYIILKVIDDDGGVGYDQATVIIQPPNQPPVADAGEDQTIYEGNTGCFDGTDSYDPDGDPIEYSWDFNNYADSDGNGNTTDDTDAIDPNPSHTYGDDGVYSVTLSVTDIHGATDSDTCVVTVLNLDPTGSIEAAYMNVEIGLRVAGRKYNDVGLTLYEEGIPIGDVSIERMPGSPDAQMRWIPITLDMTKTYSATVTFTPENPPNVGANPVWIYIKNENGSIEKIHHTFNVQQSMKRDSNRWNHVEPWEVDINHYLMGYEVTLEVSAGEPGSDDLTFDWSFGIAITYYNNGVTPDPYPSPEGIFPFSVIVTAKYVYTGSETIHLTVIDDDGGTCITSIDIA